MRLLPLLAAASLLAACGAPPAPAPRPLAPAMLEAEAAKGQAKVKAFVRAWFALFDRNAPVATYLALLDDEGLEMRFPERTLKGHADFEDWYAGILRDIAWAHHAVESIEVERVGRGRYQVRVIVLWEATTARGEAISFKADQAWTVHEAAGGGFKIARYLVGEAAQ